MPGHATNGKVVLHKPHQRRLVAVNSRSTGSGKTELSNIEIVTLAVYRLGGDLRHVETEDVAILASEFAPNRFSWLKYADQINLEIVRVALSDAKKKANGSDVMGSGIKGWMLIENGQTFVRHMDNRKGAFELFKKRVSATDRIWLKSERRRLLATVANLNRSPSWLRTTSSFRCCRGESL